MAIITDDLHRSGNDYLLELLGEKILFRKSDYIIENPLYRYRPNISRAVEEIATGRVYLSESDRQNDPFDSSYATDDSSLLQEEYKIDLLLECIAIYLNKEKSLIRDAWLEYGGKPVSDRLSVQSFIQEFSKCASTSEDRIMYGIKYILDNHTRRHGFGYKIACFSESPASIPMWAYYANCHEGVCLKYDTSRLSANPEEMELKKAFCKVHYSDYRPKDLHGEYSLVVKSSQWAHEHEWRLICKTEENHVVVPCLSAVYLGMRFDFQKVEDIVSAIKTNGAHIDLYHCVADQTKYDLCYRKINI